MAVRRWVVRVVLPTKLDNTYHVDPAFIECLRRAGLVQVQPTASSDTQVVDLIAPCKNVPDTKLWADMNAERMRSFGYNAVAAPSTEEV